MTLREAEGYNRGFFGGAVGYVNADGDGEFPWLSDRVFSTVERGWSMLGAVIGGRQ